MFFFKGLLETIEKERERERERGSQVEGIKGGAPFTHAERRPKAAKYLGACEERPVHSFEASHQCHDGKKSCAAGPGQHGHEIRDFRRYDGYSSWCSSFVDIWKFLRFSNGVTGLWP